ncbi:uncharacterized protein [Rutidosis leptorrhynchoides]|uniref:uncharacterized protein n=1 Tax=Rutidosis leptorrhynchoides TaxID=125765 RepID=UPI003A98FC59
MEIASPIDFDFNNSSYGYTSAPSSPTRLTELYCGFDQLLISSHYDRKTSLASVPFAWEEKPGVPKTPTNLSEDEFSFDVSCQFDNNPVPAEDLFHGGLIKTVDLIEERKVVRERGRERGFSSSRLPSSKSRRTRSLSPLGASDYRREQQPITVNTKPPCSPAHPSENGSKRWTLGAWW